MRKRRTRVLHVVNNLNYGGMERVIAEIVRRMDKTRFEVHVAALQYLGHFARDMEGHATLHTASRMTPLSMLRPAALARDMRRIAPDIVHSHSGSWFKASRAAGMAGVPFHVYTDHGRQLPDPWINKALDRAASRRTDVVVAVSQRLAEHLETFVVDPMKVRVVPNGVDTDGMVNPRDGESLRAELDVPCSAPIVGSVGRLEPVKGYEVLVTAFARLLEQWPAGHPSLPVLVLVGDGSEREALEALARKLGISPRVRFLGWRSDIQRCLASFTIFTMTSHSEGTSVSLLEAMSSQLCPVVTDVGGNAAVLGPELGHRIVRPNDPTVFADACLDVLLNPEWRELDAAAARARVVDHFGLDAMVRSYEDIYSRAPGNG